MKRNPRTFCLTELWLLLWQPKFAGFLMILESSDVSTLNYETVSNEQQQPPTINVMLLSQNTNKNWEANPAFPQHYAVLQNRTVEYFSLALNFPTFLFVQILGLQLSYQAAVIGKMNINFDEHRNRFTNQKGERIQSGQQKQTTFGKHITSLRTF